MGLPTDHAMTIAAQGSINDQEKKNLEGFTSSAYNHNCNTGFCQLKKKKKKVINPQIFAAKRPDYSRK